MENQKLFLKQVIKNYKHTGAVLASSPFLAKKMVQKADLNDAKTIFELGPGTGEITKNIIKKMNGDAKLWTFEINPEFIKFLKKEYPEGEHIQTDIKNIKDEIRKNSISHPDVVISGIPFCSYKKEECEEMLRSISEIMHEKTRFVLFSYSILRFKTFLSLFNKVGFDFIPLNVPPAYVLTLKKK